MFSNNEVSLEKQGKFLLRCPGLGQEGSEGSQ